LVRVAIYGNICHSRPQERAMATMNVSLPDALKAVVEERVASGEYASASDYVRDLIRKDEAAKRKWAEYHRLVQEGLDSGVSEKSFEDAWHPRIERGQAPMARRIELSDAAIADIAINSLIYGAP
jgi:antitoxin ParD1/3/4